MIETERLLLIPCDFAHFEAFFQSEQNLAELLDVSLANDWMQFPEAMPFGYKMLQTNPQNRDWGMRLFVHKKDNKLIGMGGFKGAVDARGMVEIGYEIAPDYQKQGLATEAAQGMIEYAFSFPAVKMVEAQTLPEENVSGKILRRCGLLKIGEKYDAEDGTTWHWRILRENYEKSRDGR